MTTPTPASGPTPADAVLDISVRELRLMTGRVLLTTALPSGTVAAARDLVVTAETHGLDGLAGLLADLPALRAAHHRPVPDPDDPRAFRIPAGAGRPALATAADLLDLAVAGALTDGVARLAAPGTDWAVRALVPLAARHGVLLTLTPDSVTARTAPGGPATGPDAADLRALTHGVRVPAARWRQVVAEAELALTPDSPLSRTHAGDSVFGPGGEILAEAGEDEPAGVAS
ncbi:hypothetical protein [Streptomyces sp. CRN 30]|uniref:hypothetical protein n=1 Tax=Streptomyces sp. CRN 30 TaxID=3075613 RepID=UPI002A8212FE|nr:hypothetical protein [Streptomyces sp. CRN 30]